MKRQNRIIVALLSAGITFAALFATVGTDHWKRGHYWGKGYYHHHYDHHHDQDHNHKGKEPQTDGNKDSDGVIRPGA